MRSIAWRWRWPIGIVLLAAAAIVGAVVASFGDEDPPDPAGERPAELTSPAPDPDRHAERTDRDREPGREGRDADDPHSQATPRLDEDELGDVEREVARTVRAYVRALDERDGRAACALLAPGALEAIELPRRRASCAASLRASIGYRDPRGLPVWEGARVEGILTVALEDQRASVTATTVTRFADRDEPSIEDDVVHLVRDGDRWLVAKASSTLYRAVGIDDIPLHVLAAPD